MSGTGTYFSRREWLLAALAAPAALSAASQWQIGCFTRPWDHVDYRAALDAIAEAGYKFAGLMSHSGKPRTVIHVNQAVEEAAAIGEEVRKRGMQTISIWGGDFLVAKSLEAGIEGLKKLIDNCAACRCPYLLLGGTSKPDLTERYYKAVAECCDYAASKKVMLTVKPHGGTNTTGPQCRKLIETVGHKNFTLWYDPGNIFYYTKGELDPVDDAPSVAGIVTGMCVKDFRPPGEVMLTPGTGKVNFREVLARLRKGGFRGGPLVVECLDRTDLTKLVAEARKARKFLEELVAS